MTECHEAHELLPELVLGVLGGDERARLLTHVTGCSACQEEADGLVRAAGTLLELVPPADPPAGFESRLLARRDIPVRRNQRMTLRARLASAAAALALLGGGAAIGGLAAGSSGALSAVSSPLWSPAGRVGEVVAAKGHPGVLSMTVDLGEWSGAVRCVVRQSDGREVTIGRFTVRRGYGSWTLPLRASSVTGAKLVTPAGRTLATASFSGPV